MTQFTVLYFKEHVCENIKKIDNQIIILYDEEDGNYYYYGTRNREGETKYINYSGKYHYTQLYQFTHFLYILLDAFSPLITTELHQIKLSYLEYNKLDFHYLKEKLKMSTELAAYDTKYESYVNIYNYLQSMITHQI